MLEINGVSFTPRPDCPYLHDYVDMFRSVKTGQLKGVDGRTAGEADLVRYLVRNDLWFIVAFVLKNPLANHPFVVQACNEVQNGPDSFTLDLWSREHLKSTVITHAEVIQKVLRDPNERVAIISFSQRAAIKHLQVIKQVFETSQFLYSSFHDILFQDPAKESYKWSEDGGMFLKRTSTAREATLEAWSLIDAQPVGAHFSHIVYDDVETDQTITSPDMIEKLETQFDVSMNLGASGGTFRICGTTWHHEGLLERLRARKKTNGEPLYHVRVKPATVDGHFNGEGVLHDKDWLDARRANARVFAAQCLLNPSMMGVLKLDPTLLREVEVEHIPENLYKFMLIDPAGMKQQVKNPKSDSWAILVLGVYPYRDDLGASDLYILDTMIEPMTEAEAMENICKLYLRNGRILKVGVEKVGISTTEIHVANALRAKGINLTIENESLVALRPAGRQKEVRIESALQWPLCNGKIKISKGIPSAYRERIKLEMEKFPYWRDDALDALSYGYDLIKDYKFPSLYSEISKASEFRKWERFKQSLPHRWMVN